MNDKPRSDRRLDVRVYSPYALICALALAFDLFTDYSFGALMLSTLPISLLGLSCLVVGAGSQGVSRVVAFRLWGVGAGLILLIAVAFVSLGPEQAKVGELVFTYAAMLMALPLSLVLPFAVIWLEPLLSDSVLVRIVGTWIVCVAAGWFEWSALSWLYARVRRWMSEKRSG